MQGRKKPLPAGKEIEPNEVSAQPIERRSAPGAIWSLLSMSLNDRRPPSSGARGPVRPALIVDRVSKKFSRRSNRHLGYGLGDLAGELLHSRARAPLRKDEFWAVDRVSLILNAGDSLALIGRNGSGKTTLLKMIAGLAKPDRGTIVVEGAARSLINLGAGFHVDLTGRRNIRTIAALQGFGRRETLALEEDIIAFSELEEVIDCPFWTYSSGMKARLGFASAVCTRPDILLIDEILSVGDAAFQNKCFIRLHELRNGGTTIVFVSHSQTHVAQLCEKAVWLEQGQARLAGEAKETMKRSLAFMDERRGERLNRLQPAESETAQETGPPEAVDPPVRDLEIHLRHDGQETRLAPIHGELEIDFAFETRDKPKDLAVFLRFWREDGSLMATIDSRNGQLLHGARERQVRGSVRLRDANFNPSAYSVQLRIVDAAQTLFDERVLDFAIQGGDRLYWEMVEFRHDFLID